MKNSLSVIIQGKSNSGKSTIANIFLQLFKEERQIVRVLSRDFDQVQLNIDDDIEVMIIDQCLDIQTISEHEKVIRTEIYDLMIVFYLTQNTELKLQDLDEYDIEPGTFDLIYL